MHEIKIDYQLRQVNTYLIQYGKENMGNLDMTSAQSMVLAYLLLQKKEEYCLTEVCTELGLTKATVSVMLKALREKGYVKMDADPGDDRRKRILLTGRAYEAETEIENHLKKRGDRMFQGITVQELENLEKTLDKMIGNLKSTAENSQREEEAMI